MDRLANRKRRLANGKGVHAKRKRRPSNRKTDFATAKRRLLRATHVRPVPRRSSITASRHFPHTAPARPAGS